MRTHTVVGEMVGALMLCGLLVPEALATVPVGPSDVYIEGTQLIVRKRKADGSLDAAKPYIIKGVTYSPATRAPAYGPNPFNPNITVPYGFFFDWPGRDPQGHVVLGFWMQEEVQARYSVDLPLIANMSANTIRLYNEPNSDPLIVSQILDACYENGIMVIMTVAQSKTDLDSGRHLVIVNQYKDHPAILMWALGNEWNFTRYYGYVTMTEAITATNTAAEQIKLSDSNHPVSSSLGDRFSQVPPTCNPQDPCCGPPPSDYAQTAISYIVPAVPNVDIWGLNVYRGTSFGELFNQWQSVSATLPFYMSEFGTDSFLAESYQVVSCYQADEVNGQEAQAQQAALVQGLWSEIAPQLSAVDTSAACTGGFVHEFNDELWKVGSYHVGLGGLVDYNGPDNIPNTADDDTSYDEYNREGYVLFSGIDNVLNEEYFGLVNADRAPKQAYDTLQQFYFSLPNILQNSGFEQDKQSWHFPANGSINTEFFQSGVKSAKLVGTGTIASHPTIAVTAAEEYKVAGWVKIQDIVGSARGESGVQIRLQWYDVSGKPVDSSNLVSKLKGSQDWTRYASTFTAPAAAASARLQLRIVGNGTTGQAWFDSLSISP